MRATVDFTCEACGKPGVKMRWAFNKTGAFCTRPECRLQRFNDDRKRKGPRRAPIVLRVDRVDLCRESQGACLVQAEGCPFESCRHNMPGDILEPGIHMHNWQAPLRQCAIAVSNEGPRTHEEVAIVLGVTRQRVHQIERKAMARMSRKAKRIAA